MTCRNYFLVQLQIDQGTQKKPGLKKDVDAWCVAWWLDHRHSYVVVVFVFSEKEEVLLIKGSVFITPEARREGFRVAGLKSLSYVQTAAIGNIF